MNDPILMYGDEPIGQLYKNSKAQSTSIARVVTNPLTGDGISQGSGFMLDGKRCVALINIATGTTMVEHTHYEYESVEEKIDKVASDKQNEFALLGSVRGVGDVSLPNTWKEIIVQVTGSQNAILTTHFLRRMTTNTAVNASLGNYGTSYAVGSIATTFVHLSVMNWAGQDITSTSTMYVYVRE